MTNLVKNRVRIATLLLFALFFLIACGLGYPILNRYDPRQTPGLSDVKIYAQMVTASASADAAHVRFRVLVPWLAKCVYWILNHVGWLAKGRTATWDPVMFSLLVADSVFVAATALLIVVLAIRHIGDPAVALVGAFVYLVNFAVPNLRLVGLVDAGEGFFLLALLCCLAECNLRSLRLWSLPFWCLLWIAILGTLAKESFIPFGIAFSAVWWLASRKEAIAARPHSNDIAPHERSKKTAIWLATSWTASLVVFVLLHRAIAGIWINPVEFGFGLHRGQDYLAHFARSLRDRQLWYIFLWLLPLAIPKLKRLPRSWFMASGATCAVAFALDAFYGGAPGTIGRALFSIAGPVLSLSSAMLLMSLL